MKDLTGDPVFDHFNEHKKEGVTLKGRIIENEKHTYNSPRKLIEIEVTDGKITDTFTYNYNKILNAIPKKLILDPTVKETTGSIIL